MEVFFVEHIYERNGEEEIKFIGVFSTRKKAQDAIAILITKPGFKDFSIENFEISVGELDRCEWNDGFTNWKDALEKP